MKKSKLCPTYFSHRFTAILRAFCLFQKEQSNLGKLSEKSYPSVLEGQFRNEKFQIFEKPISEDKSV